MRAVVATDQRSPLKDSCETYQFFIPPLATATLSKRYPESDGGRLARIPP